MKKILIIALCVAIPMVGFAQKKAKKGKKAQEEVVVAPVVEVLDDEECLMLLSLSHESVKAEQYDDVILYAGTIIPSFFQKSSIVFDFFKYFPPRGKVYPHARPASGTGRSPLRPDPGAW